jgi:hypothetical protein
LFTYSLAPEAQKIIKLSCNKKLPNVVLQASIALSVMTRLLHSITGTFLTIVRLVDNNYSSWLLLSLLHTALLVAAGYSMVICSLPMLAKTGLFCFICFASVGFLYKALMRSRERCAFQRH